MFARIIIFSRVPEICSRCLIKGLGCTGGMPKASYEFKCIFNGGNRRYVGGRRFDCAAVKGHAMKQQLTCQL